MSNNKIKMFGITFKNRVFLASGVFGFGLKYPRVTAACAAIFTKGVTLKPRAGNPPPRVYETAAGMINWVGLENPGVKAFVRDILPRMKKLKTRIFVNVAGFTIDEYAAIVGEIGERVDGFEINVSCPNVKEGGTAFGQDPKLVAAITRRVRKETRRPLVVKLTANFVDPKVTARAAADNGADGISLINTVFGTVWDPVRRKPIITGGLSGPAIKPFALYCVNRIRDLGVPVIGLGGIMTGRDAFEFLLAGASAVAVGSALVRDPYAPLRIIKELDSYLLCHPEAQPKDRR
jgi:dihydroorotate dehydrogenase (NAD+) catalytic subunit